LETWRPIAGGAKAVLCTGRHDLDRLWARAEVQGIPLTIQEYIPGDETRVVSYHAFIDHAGSVVGEFCGRKIRTLPFEFGLSTAVEIADLPRVRTMGLEVLRSFDFTGVAKVDFKEAPNGDLYVLEVNPRFNLWHHPGAAAGVNLPAAVHSYLTEGRSDRLPAATPGVRWVQVWGDARAARVSGMSWGEWVRFVASAETRRAFHLTDPGSALGALTYGLRQRLGLAPHS
jgi:predicted ATP-grasp superfamily ATP-dependent carboligase